MNIISFPGLGIDKITINPVAFEIFGHEIAWYGIIITFAMVVAFFYTLYRAVKCEGMTTDDVLDYAIWVIVCGVIGARAYYVIMKGGYTTFYSMIAVWNGGLAIYGGVIGGVLAAIVVSLVKKKKFGKIADAIAPGLMLAQAIGRWGNFVNAEAFGEQTTLPWRMGIEILGQTIYVHPTFLYESIWNLIGFILINFLYKKKKFDGHIFLCYLSWYGFGRTLIEGLRTDSLYLGSTSIRVSQLLGALTFVCGIVLIIIFSVRASKKPVTEGNEAQEETVSEVEEAPAEATASETTENAEEISDKAEEKSENDPE